MPSNHLAKGGEERIVGKIGLVLVGIGMLAVLGIFPVAAGAQQLDAAFGAGTVTAPSAFDADINHSPVSVAGGTYLAFSADYLLKHSFGIGGEVAWRASQGNYADLAPFRPIFYDFNGVYAPPLGKHLQADLQAGIGAQSTRFYNGFISCNSFTGTCTNYQSSNHFMGHFGAGIRLYLMGNVFIRPEAHLYLVHNNFEFSANRATRFGASIGYSFGRQ